MAGRPSIADIGTRLRGKALVDATNVRFVYVQPCAAHHALRRMSPQMALSEFENQTGLGGQPDTPGAAAFAQGILRRTTCRPMRWLSMQHRC